jgi:hypothetical protein
MRIGFFVFAVVLLFGIGACAESSRHAGTGSPGNPAPGYPGRQMAADLESGAAPGTQPSR